MYSKKKKHMPANREQPGTTGNEEKTKQDSHATGSGRLQEQPDRKASRYIKRAGDIEDLPDAADQQEADDTLRKKQQDD